MKECLKIWLEASFITPTFEKIYTELVILCNEIDWKIKITKAVLTNDNRSKGWCYEFAVNFDKDNKTIYIGVRKKIGYSNFDACLLYRFENYHLDKNISIIRKYMLFNGNSSEYAHQSVTSNDKYLSSLISKFQNDRGLANITLWHVPQIINRIAYTRIDFTDTRALRISELFDSKEDKNLVSMMPKNGSHDKYVNIITDSVFQEIFGVKSGDFLKASNSKLPDISSADCLKSNMKSDSNKDLFMQYLHINGKIICNSEFLQMADIGFNQLDRLLNNAVSSSAIGITTRYDYGENSRSISLFIETENSIDGLLGNLYTINIEGNDDPYYKPSFDKYELFLTEENELKLIKK